MQGEEYGEVLAEQDTVTCCAHVMLLRANHQASGFDPDSIKGTAARVSAACSSRFRKVRDKVYCNTCLRRN